MQSEYLSYVDQDPELTALVRPIQPQLERLTAEQVETLTFYLKSLHAYYPASENDIQNSVRFETQLDALRDSASQKGLQRRAARQVFGAMCLSACAGAAFLAGLAAWLLGAAGRGGGLVVVAGALFFLAEVRFGGPALITAKEQDRRYFLESIRAARGCNELDWAGLFSYPPTPSVGPQSEEDLLRTNLRVAELSRQLRAALYNDEFMQYSSERSGAGS